MTEFIQNLIGNDYIATLIMSLVPLIELKGGIVFARGAGLGFFESLGLAYIGSTIVFIPIFFLLKPILNWLKRIKWFNKFAMKIENYFQSKADGALDDATKKTKKHTLSETRLKQLGVLIFVAIPLPMTGIWTGTAIAVFLGLKFKDTIIPAVIGNLIAGLLICALVEICNLIGINLDIVLWCLFGLAVILLAITIIKIVTQKPKAQTVDSIEEQSKNETDKTEE